MLRLNHGNMDAELLSKLLRRPLSLAILQQLDFTPNPKYEDAEDYGT